MHHFTYRDGRLHAEDVDLRHLADTFGTPFYCYSSATLERHYRVFAEAFAGTDALVCYAVKANSNQAVLATLARLGAGMDIVSEGELRRALAAKVPAERIVFSGIGKTKDEMAAGLDAGILCFNVESEPELEALAEVATAKGRRAPISVRVNPDVDARTHRKIATGKSENKFGIPIARAREVYARRGAAAGAQGHRRRHAHRQPDHRARAVRRTPPSSLPSSPASSWRKGTRFVTSTSAAGSASPIARHDPPPPEPQAYAAIIKRHTQGLGLKLIFEIGRMIAGNAGILVMRVVYVKHGEGKVFVIVDAGMNDLIRPTLYEAEHEIKPVREPAPGAARIVADVVGPVCETGDYLALGRELTAPKAGDLLAIMTAGAYGAVQGSTYNTRPLVPEILVRGTDAALVRPRQTYDELIGLDRVPEWLA